MPVIMYFYELWCCLYRLEVDLEFWLENSRIKSRLTARLVTSLSNCHESRQARRWPFLLNTVLCPASHAVTTCVGLSVLFSSLIEQCISVRDLCCLEPVFGLSMDICAQSISNWKACSLVIHWRRNFWMLVLAKALIIWRALRFIKYD
jgi:hypothetical protein